MVLYNINMVTRKEWGGREPAEPLPPFEPPAFHVTLTLLTDFGECFTKDECSQKVRAIQNKHMDEWGLPDIRYNFLFGDDGNVYEGRGWDFKPPKSIETRKKDNPGINDHRTYEFAVIGDYRDEIPEEVVEMAQSLLTYGVQYKHVAEEYTYVGHDCDDDPNIPEIDPKEFIKSRVTKTVIIPRTELSDSE